MDIPKNSILEACNLFISRLSDSAKENQENYQSYAELYDKMMDLGYRSPDILSKMCMKHLSRNSAETVFLDVASGTGRMGQVLKSCGYKGIIDGIEASSEMIEESMKKDKVYREVKMQFLSENQPMPYPENSYDAVVCAGALCVGHIPHQCIEDMIRVLTPGGILLFNVSRLECDKDNSAVTAVQEFMKKMVSENRCQILEEICEPAWYQTDEKAYYYCFKK